MLIPFTAIISSAMPLVILINMPSRKIVSVVQSKNNQRLVSVNNRKASTQKLVRSDAPFATNYTMKPYHNESGLGGNVTRVQGVQPMLANDNARFVVPSNLSWLKDTRVSSVMTRFQSYKLQKLRVVWAPSMPVTAPGSITLGTMSTGTTMVLPMIGLPMTNGGAFGPIYQTVVSNVECGQYFDHWRPVEADEVALTNPFSLFINAEGVTSTGYLTSGRILIEYDMLLCNPIGIPADTISSQIYYAPFNCTVPGAVNESGKVNLNLMGVAEAATGDDVKIMLANPLENVAIGSQASGSETIPAGTWLRAIKTIAGTAANYLLKTLDGNDILGATSWSDASKSTLLLLKDY